MMTHLIFICRVMPTLRCLKIREHTHHRLHINIMETINELIQLDRQVAELAVIQVATQIITIELVEMVKSVLCAILDQKIHKDFIQCLIVNILHVVHVWKAI